MRRPLLLAFAALFLASIFFAVPAGANDSPPLIEYLAGQACSGAVARKNACSAYLFQRLIQFKSSDAALTHCEKRCELWYGPDKSGASGICKEACNFIRRKDN